MLLWWFGETQLNTAGVALVFLLLCLLHTFPVSGVDAPVTAAPSSSRCILLGISALVSHSVFSDRTLNDFCSVFQDSGISGRKRKASTSLTDDEGLSPSRCSWLSAGLSDSAARELAQCPQGVEYGPARKSQWFRGLCCWGLGS